VLPKNKVISSQVEIDRIERTEDGVLVIAQTSLWVDGMRIYRAKNLGMRITRGAPQKKKPSAPITSANAQATTPNAAIATGQVGVVELALDPSVDLWLADHCPTYTRPALPMMSTLDLMGRAASKAAGGAMVVEVNDLQAKRWVIVDEPRRVRAVAKPAGEHRYTTTLEVWWEAPNAAMSRWEEYASGVVIVAPGQITGPVQAPGPLTGAQPLHNPYLSGALFHGPAFQMLMDGALLARNGSAGLLDIARCGVPAGLLQPGLLDGALHIVPHEAMGVWTSERSGAQVAYPHRLQWARFAGPTPTEGVVAVDVRFVGFEDAEERFPIIDIWLSAGGRPWAQLRLVEVLMPKGPLGQPNGLVRRAFLGQRRAVPGLMLSQEIAPGAVKLTPMDVAQSSWFKGTLEAVYDARSKGEQLVRELALKEAVALAAHGAVHPSSVIVDQDGDVLCPSLPLERITAHAEQQGEATVATAALEADWSPVRAWWLKRLGMPQGWFGDLLYWALLKRYARHVIVQDPAGMAAIRGRSVLFLGNHQVQVESILVTAIGSWLTDTTVVTMANAKHEQRWVGSLVHGTFGQPGCEDPRNIVYFDQSKPELMPALIAGFKADVAARGASIMVHASGTRQVRAGQRVEKVTSMLLDMAAELGMPIVPVHFAGGLPVEPLDHKLEVPYGHAAQDYIFGAPIMPEELAALPYAQRRQRVLTAINALSPVFDAPHSPNPAVSDRVEAAAPGAQELVSVWAAIEDALGALEVPSEEAIALLKQMRAQ
jgi:hypothetical protein